MRTRGTRKRRTGMALDIIGSLVLAGILSSGLVFVVRYTPITAHASGQEVITLDESTQSRLFTLAQALGLVWSSVRSGVMNPQGTETVDSGAHQTGQAPVQKVDTLSPRQVPFYSQFRDISSPSWKKLSCGIAGLAMLLEYAGKTTTPDRLLDEGIAQGAFIAGAGWSHAGLIELAKVRGLSGSAQALYDDPMPEAFRKLTQAVGSGPVMASVYYKLEPGHPIPHLIVVNDIKDGIVYYNDPANEAGNSTIDAAAFQTAWKKRYITIF